MTSKDDYSTVTGQGVWQLCRLWRWTCKSLEGLLCLGECGRVSQAALGGSLCLRMAVALSTHPLLHTAGKQPKLFGWWLHEIICSEGPNLRLQSQTLLPTFKPQINNHDGMGPKIFNFYRTRFPSWLPATSAVQEIDCLSFFQPLDWLKRCLPSAPASFSISSVTSATP